MVNGPHGRVSRSAGARLSSGPRLQKAVRGTNSDCHLHHSPCGGSDGPAAAPKRLFLARLSQLRARPFRDGSLVPLGGLVQVQGLFRPGEDVLRGEGSSSRRERQMWVGPAPRCTRRCCSQTTASRQTLGRDVSIQAEIILSAAAPSASTPSLARAVVWFTLVHTAPLVLLIAADVLPSKFAIASVQADQPSHIGVLWVKTGTLGFREYNESFRTLASRTCA